MNVSEILAHLKSERDRLDRAIIALSGGPGTRRRSAPTSAKSLRGKRRNPRRRIGAAARKRMSQAMTKRWAEGKQRGRRRL